MHLATVWYLPRDGPVIPCDGGGGGDGATFLAAIIFCMISRGYSECLNFLCARANNELFLPAHEYNTGRTKF